MARILVVDDVPANVEILSFHLGDEGYDVIEAQGGEQALTTLKQQHEEIDLVLLDVMMPVMSGLDVLAEMKRHPDLQSIPVILVTANADDQNVAEGLDMGAFDYIIKPYSLVVLLARVRAALREKERLDLLEKWATSDPLTSLYNRRHFFELAHRELERSLRHNSDLSFIMLDIDHFKQVNDQHGHLVGDEVLICVANQLRDLLRKVDFCARFGGEEFVLCLPDTQEVGATEVAERIRQTIANHAFKNNDDKPFSITVSLGLASRKDEADVEQIIRRADDALYKAKENGRNQTQVG